MPDSHKELFKYSRYFTKILPNPFVLLLAIVAIGMITGILAIGIIHFGSSLNYGFLIIYGASAGIFIVSIPAILTTAIIKVIKRSMLLKHVMFAVMVSSASYAVFIIIASAIYLFLKSYVITYIIVILANAGIYGYWLIVGRFIISKKRSVSLSAVVQPVFNILMYVPFGKYIIAIGLPLGIAMLKMLAGMLVFLIVGYIFLYVVDTPMKRKLNVSSVEIFSIMVNQWLYNTGTMDLAAPNFGIKTKLNVDLLIFSKDHKGNQYSAIFAKPDIHYGPFAGTGGAIATAYIGNALKKRYGAAPFVLHGAVNIEDNPISAAQVYNITNEIVKHINLLPESAFKDAIGGIGFGAKGTCKATSITVNDCSIITLTRAPMVTEDIDHIVGLEFESIARKYKLHPIIIDAHNSRIESAPKEELRGVHAGSPYVEDYKKAIEESLNIDARSNLTFGAASIKAAELLNKPKDLGNGFTSACVFGIGRRKFCMIYFDANNMLPSFRRDMIEHVKSKFHMDCEVYTSDTHSVNSLAFTASNVLGRYTSAKAMESIVDSLVEVASKSATKTKAAHLRFTIDNFMVWGDGVEEQIKKASTEIIRKLKHIVPVVITAGFIAAAWLIYLV